MFGKKNKKQNAQNAAASVEQQTPMYMQPEPRVYYESEVIMEEVDDEDVVEIELILDNETLKGVKQNNGEAADVQQPIIEGYAEEVVKHEAVSEPVSQQVPLIESQKETPKEEPAKVEEKPVEQQQQRGDNYIYVTTNVVNSQPEPAPAPTPEPAATVEPEVRYVVEAPEEDEIIKPAKLVKLPNLVDYMLSLNMSKRMKMNVATLLLGAYAKYKDIPAEKTILIGCMKKIMFALMNS